MASHLIALDKCPGIRPIGIGKGLCRILGDVLALTTQYEVEDIFGLAQLCSGLKSGIDGAIYALWKVFAEKAGTGLGVLLIDARNAFNSLNWVLALWNARALWPLRSRFLFNTYRGHAALAVYGSKEYVYKRRGNSRRSFLYAVLCCCCTAGDKITCTKKHAVSGLVCRWFSLCCGTDWIV